jgi:hypothetical protein
MLCVFLIFHVDARVRAGTTGEEQDVDQPESKLKFHQAIRFISRKMVELFSVQKL